MNLCLGFSFKFGFNREREREHERGEKVAMKGESMNCVIMINMYEDIIIFLKIWFYKIKY